jgi:hypothetical protein
VVDFKRYGRGFLYFIALNGILSGVVPKEQNQKSFLLDQIGSTGDPDESTRKSSILFENENMYELVNRISENYESQALSSGQPNIRGDQGDRHNPMVTSRKNEMRLKYE